MCDCTWCPLTVLTVQLVDATWNRIKGFAAQDSAIWKQGDGTRGYTQITTEFIPIRAKQLLEVCAGTALLCCAGAMCLHCGRLAET